MKVCFFNTSIRGHIMLKRYLNDKEVLLFRKKIFLAAKLCYWFFLSAHLIIY